MKKFKYSRKEIADWLDTGIYTGDEVINKLFAKQRYKKECKHDWRQDKTTEGFINCVKCGKMEELKQVSPSPLDQLEEIEELWIDHPEFQISSDKAINSLIHNQNIIIDFIKSKEE